MLVLSNAGTTGLWRGIHLKTRIGGIFTVKYKKESQEYAGLCNYSRRRETRLTVYPAIEIPSEKVRTIGLWQKSMRKGWHSWSLP
mgnify:CR=1 FL=1